MMKLTRNDTSVGVFLLVAIAGVMAFFVTKAGSQGWLRGTKRFEFKTFDGRNIKPQAPVRMRGVDVGQVEDIHMDETAQIQIKFRVEARFSSRIREDATATLVSPPVIGLTYVDIDPGNPNLDEKHSGPIEGVEAPSLVASVEGSVARIANIMKKAERALDTINVSLEAVNKITTAIADGDGAVSRLVKDSEMGHDVKRATHSAANIAEDLTEASASIRRREGVIGRILSSDAIAVEAEKLLARARQSLDMLDDVTKRLTGSVEMVANRLDQAGASVEGVKAVVENTARLSGELADLTAKINHGQGSVGKMLTDDSIFVEAKSLLKELRESVQDLREQAPINSFIGVVFSAF